MPNFDGWEEELQLIVKDVKSEAVEATLEALKEQLSGGTLNIDTGRLINSLEVTEEEDRFTISTNVVYGVYWEVSGKKPWATNAHVEARLQALSRG